MKVLAEARRPLASHAAFVLLALALGAVAGWLAWLTDEVVPAVAMVLLSTAVLGFLRPKLSPLTALVVGLCVPLFYVVSSAVGYPTRFPSEPGPWASAVVLIPAAFGAAVGAGARLVANEAASNRR